MESHSGTMSDVQRDLIFDLGLHRGFDSEFYLQKGFRVVALEAVPELCKIAEQHLASHQDKLVVINKALAERPGEHVTFYTVPGKDDWGSLFKGIAEKGVEHSTPIQVETIDLRSIFDRHGVPYYLKCDLEGGDKLLREQLLLDTRRPTFVSVEMNDGQEGSILRQCGYEMAQIVNQLFNGRTIPPNPAREGSFADAKFHGHMSGLFGLELPSQKWFPIEQADEIYARWKSLRDFDQDLAPGWVDLHVCRADALK